MKHKSAQPKVAVAYGIVAATAALTAAVAAFTALSGPAQPAALLFLRMAPVILVILAVLLAGLAWLARRMHAQLRAGFAEIEALRAKIRALEAGNTKDLAAISARLTHADQARDELKRALANAEGLLKTRASSEAVAHVTARIAKLEPWLARVSAQLNTRASGETVSALGGRVNHLEQANKSFHVHNRSLSEADIRELLEKWVAPLGLAQTRSGVRYLAERFKNLERLCAGRLATDMQTLLARAFSALSIDRNDIHIAEIGVLFGVASGAIYDACRFEFDSVKLTLIDPLKGYYDRSNADIITQVAVNRRVLDHNLAAMGVPRSDVTIIENFSESSEALAAIREQTIDLLVIDGDHSYAGVKRDFENYRDLVRAGGLILFDDYDTSDWPEIREYVDKEVRPNKDMELVAAGFRTALFRKTGDSAAA